MEFASNVPSQYLALSFSENGNKQNLKGLTTEIIYSHNGANNQKVINVIVRVFIVQAIERRDKIDSTRLDFILRCLYSRQLNTRW